uniref:Complement C3-like n=1 Tax=Sinocyclocheilus rhinocerous TaxID=307959 RepID=A0A673L956_9TELE
MQPDDEHDACGHSDADCRRSLLPFAHNMRPTNLFVEAQDYTGGDLNVRIIVKNHPKKNLDILSKSVTLTAANNFQILNDIKIPDDQKFFSDDPLEKQYVYLQAQFPSVTLEKVVMLSFQTGYIFVQTDKPIYTPHRNYPITGGKKKTEFLLFNKNPQGITLDRDQFQPRQGIRTENFALPELASAGIWKLIAKYTNTPQKNFTTEFEVMEYVLPSFEVTLNPRKSFFYVNEHSLAVDISAKYLFGNKVRGTAFVVFGVIDNEKKISIASSLQRVQIIDGEGEAALTRQMITANFPDIQQLVGNSLYISASVLTETGSEMVEAHKKGIHIVTSPYTILFKRTPHFFKPGMPFDVSVYVTNPDQTPAKNVEVEVNPGGVKGRTRANGIAKVTVNTPGGSSTLEITAKTKDPQIRDEQQAVKKMTAQAYIPKGGSNNYLHIGIDAAELQIGDQMKVNLNLGNSPGGKKQDFTYMILSKGQIVRVERFKMTGQSLVTLSLSVTKEMVPSFRFVAYYNVDSSEVVSDSVWVDMKDTCMGTLKVEVKDPTLYGPGDQLSLKITGDPGAKVGLVAVDKGVYVLNDKNRLTQTKIWDIIEKHDTGCTAGGGRDSMGVFTDAGLMFESNTAGGTNTRTNIECPVPPKRKRRAQSLLQVTTTLGKEYSGDLKKCCVDGLQDNILGYSCERRASYIIDEDECVKAFLHCCKEMQRHKADFAEKEFFLARSEEDDFDEELGEVMVRTQFPESWLWEEIDLPHCPQNQLTGIFLKDSITTWQITAISLSKTLGMCVADPYEITVRKDFFIDLKMPYSAVHNEQLEIKAVLHNYSNQKLKVCAVLLTSEGVCSSASKKQKGRVTVSVGPMSSVAIPVIIIPMELKEQWIEAEAYSSNRNDAIRKNLKVVVSLPCQHLEEGSGGSQVVSMRSDIPRRKVPNTPASTVITVIGEEITRTVEQAISGHFMGQLIVQPNGCGEQNMIYMTLPLIATHYLDSTKQWEAVGMERRNEAVNHIRTGYQRELTFRKGDGSYGAWIHVPSSTWLTAYVAKVFAMASDLIVIEENVICSALTWLATKKQTSDGAFKEDAPVYHSEMVGNVRGKDADTSLTAFVLTAMQEGSKICARSVSVIPGNTIDYLLLRVHSLTSTYAVAMTSYALAHAGKLNKDILKSYSTKSKDGVFWQVPGEHHHSLEATGYAVLALVMAKDFESAGLAVRWLGKQQSRYGGYGTTQATIMVFQAVAEYRIQVKKVDINLNLELAVQERKEKTRIAIRPSNLHLSRSDKVWKYEGMFAPLMLRNRIKMLFNAHLHHTQLLMHYYIILILLCSFKDPLRSSTMSILDIGLLTGFKVDEHDLSKVNKRHQGLVVFRMHKINEVGMLQPAGVTVYEYNRCVKFYHPHKKDGSLNRLCHEDLCQCAEENCSLQKNEHIDEENREEKACEREVEYGKHLEFYKTRVLEMGLSLHADIYNMTIEQVLKEGMDVEGSMRSFLAHPFCRDFLKFEKGKTYLIMGQTKTLPRIGGKLRYHLGEDTWIEYWPTEKEAQTSKHRAKYIGITALAKKLQSGCST